MRVSCQQLPDNLRTGYIQVRIEQLFAGFFHCDVFPVAQPLAKLDWPAVPGPFCNQTAP